MEPITVVHVKKFLQHGSARVITITEMQEFWKSLTEEEKSDYRSAVSTWNGESYYC